MKKKAIMITLTILLMLFVIIFEIRKSYGSNLNDKKVKSIQNKINKYSTMDDISFESNKINIYFFWGENCPHCKKEFKFFENIEKDYYKYFNIYAFEIYNNKNNINVLNSFADILKTNVTGIPFTIIGEKTFIGFAESMENSFKETIKNQSKNEFDVYRIYKKTIISSK